MNKHIEAIRTWFKNYFHKHKPLQDSVLIEFNSGEKWCLAHCEKCNKRLLGRYSQGLYSKEWFWTYIEHQWLIPKE